MDYNKFTKKELVSALQSFDQYTQSRIDRLLSDVMYLKEKAAIDAEEEQFKQNLAEYEMLRNKWYANGLKSLTSQEILRLMELPKLLSKV